MKTAADTPKPAKTGEAERELAGSPGLGGFGVARGQAGDRSAPTLNPREAAARALADAVVQALRSGDLGAARAAARALGTLVDELAAVEPGRVADLSGERKARGSKGR